MHSNIVGIQPVDARARLTAPQQWRNAVDVVVDGTRGRPHECQSNLDSNNNKIEFPIRI